MVTIDNVGDISVRNTYNDVLLFKLFTSQFKCNTSCYLKTVF